MSRQLKASMFRWFVVGISFGTLTTATVPVPGTCVYTGAPPYRNERAYTRLPLHDGLSIQDSKTELRIDQRQSIPPPPLEIVPLLVSGPSSNRVDLVFFSDGYVPVEKSKFFSDALRLAEDISGNQTFNTVRPLLNFWAAYTPSKESGVGVGGVPKDTPFGLYRDGTELRGVYYAHPELARAACDSLQDQCDYPILLGNDPLYGGMLKFYYLPESPLNVHERKDWVVNLLITSSRANGPIILRHELGHSIIEVGEEYDGGFAYFGVNAYHNLSEPVPWAHWLTTKANLSESLTPHNHDFAPPRVERSVMPLQKYVWTLLNTTKPWSTTFMSSGSYDRFLIRVSQSGLPAKTDFRVELDGVDLGWSPPADIGIDRYFSDYLGNFGLKGGQHELRFTLLNAQREGSAQLGSVEVEEFGDEKEFIADPGYYGVFPTFSDSNETSYRPTNEDCLMRQVTTPNLCKVCREGLWYSLLRRVRLIEGLTQGCNGRNTTLTVKLMPLAQFREAPINVAESWSLTWSKNGQVLPQFANKTTLSVASTSARGSYAVNVKFSTEEVRKESAARLTDRLVYNISTVCSS